MPGTLNGIPIESGVNNCYFNFKSKCVNKEVTRSTTTMPKDWDSKRNCGLTIFGVHVCGGYKPDKG